MNQAAPKPQFLVYRKLGTLTYSAFDQTRTIDIDRLHGLRFIDLHADFQVDGVTATTTGALLGGAPFHFLTDITLKGNGKDAVYNGTGYGAYLQNFFDYGVAPSSTLPAVGDLDTANAVFNFATRLDLALPYNRVPIDTALITTLFAVLQLSVSIGSVEDEIVDASNTGTWTFDTGTIDVYVGEIINFDATRFGRIIAKHYYIEAQPTGNSSAYDIILPTGNAYRSMLIEAVTAVSGINPTPANTIVNNIIVKAGSQNFLDVEDDAARRIPAMERRIAEQTGAYFLDFSRDGLIAEALDASVTNNLKLTLDVTNQSGNRLRVHCIELIPV